MLPCVTAIRSTIGKAALVEQHRLCVGRRVAKHRGEIAAGARHPRDARAFDTVEPEPATVIALVTPREQVPMVFGAHKRHRLHLASRRGASAAVFVVDDQTHLTSHGLVDRSSGRRATGAATIRRRSSHPSPPRHIGGVAALPSCHGAEQLIERSRAVGREGQLRLRGEGDRDGRRFGRGERKRRQRAVLAELVASAATVLRMNRHTRFEQRGDVAFDGARRHLEMIGQPRGIAAARSSVLERDGDGIQALGAIHAAIINGDITMPQRLTTLFCMSEIVLFHSGLGLRPQVRRWSARLEAEGHHVHTPDLYDGEVFDDLERGVAKRDALGIEELSRRGMAAVADLPEDIIYAGFSLGAASAQALALTRPFAGGTPRKRRLVMMHGALPLAAFGLSAWPAHLRGQFHASDADRWVDNDTVANMDASAPDGALELFRYEGSAHLFADDDHADFNADHAELMFERVKRFVA